MFGTALSLTYAHRCARNGVTRHLPWQVRAMTTKIRLPEVT